MNASRQITREHAEPTEGGGHLSPLVLLLIGALSWFGLDYLLTRYDTDPYGFGGDQRSAYTEPDHERPGEAIFGQRCASCHQADGRGVAGTYPPLAGSHWVTRDAETPVRILLRGVQGPIEVGGVTYSGVMPRADDLDDAAIARVLTHVRTSWGNEAEPVTPQLVAEIRAELADRPAPWSGGGELEAIREVARSP